MSTSPPGAPVDVLGRPGRAWAWLPAPTPQLPTMLTPCCCQRCHSWRLAWGLGRPTGSLQSWGVAQGGIPGVLPRQGSHHTQGHLAEPEEQRQELCRGGHQEAA